MKKRILTLFALCAALILLTAGAQAEEGPAVETVHVEDAQQLMDFLTDGASNRVILLDAKDYVIYDEYTNASGGISQSGFSVENLNNVTIRGQAGTQILTPYDCGGYAVLTFTNCVNVTLDTLSVGHQDAWCNAPVLALSNSTGVEILNCDLWGCGEYGIKTSGSTSFHAQNTTIHDCSQFIMRLTGCTATFDNCYFRKNGGDSNPGASGGTSALQGSPVQVVFNNCDFTDNDCSYKIQSGQESKYTFNDNCTEVDNTWQLSLGDTVSIDLTPVASLTLDRITGRATVTGSGSLSSSSVSELISSDIKSLEIGSGITELGYCFSNCSALTSVTLPDTLQQVGFPGCSSLESINIPNSVTTIGSFYGCTALKEINIPNGVTSIGDFSNCTSLQEINIPDSVTSIGGFSGCTSLMQINIPSGVTRIESFFGCTSLTQINIPDGVTYLGSFSGCSSLQELHIPDSVTSLSYSMAFSNCTALTAVNIPDGVTKLGAESFSGCTSLTEIDIPSSVTSIGQKAFSGCTSLTSVNIPNGVTAIESNMFENCTSLTAVVLPDSVTSIGQYAFQNCTALPAIRIPAGVTSIEYSTFDGCTSLASVNIPDSVTTIGWYAFRNCGLTKLNIPNGVQTLYGQAFNSCKNLEELVIPDSVASIGSACFDGCTGIKRLTIPAALSGSSFNNSKSISHVTVTGQGTLQGSSAWKAAEVPCTVEIMDGVTSIGSGAFSGSANLVKVIIPDSVTSIGANAFYSCTSLTGVTLPRGITTIETYTFYNCSSLINIVLPDGITSIGDRAFEGCSSLTGITLPSKITSIGYSTFRNCSNLTTVALPDGITSIGNAAFQSCSSLTGIVLPERITSIGDDAFDSCSSLASILIPDHVTSIGRYAFENCTGLQSVTLPVTIALTYSQFSGCSNVAYVKVTGTGAISSSSCNPWIVTKVPVFVELAEGITAIGANAFSNCKMLTGITIPDTVTDIGTYAFYQSGLTEADIPEGVTEIKDSTFQNCANLTSVTLPNGITVIGANAFQNSGLTDIVIPSGVTEIKYQAFSACKNLTEIVFPDNVTLANYTFSSCTGLRSVTLPVTAVASVAASKAFNGCTGVTYVRIIGRGPIPDMAGTTSNDGTPWKATTAPVSVELDVGITEIGNYIFYYSQTLTDITIPDTVTRIGDSAFGLCNKLTRIEIPSSVNSIDKLAFYNVVSLTDVYYAGSEDAWKSATGDNLDLYYKTTVHYNTTESAHISSEIDTALAADATLASVQASLGALNKDSLSQSLLDSAVTQKIVEKEGTTTVQVDSTENLGISASDISITGAKVNFPDTTDVTLKLDAPSDATITVPPAEKALRFSASLVSGGTELNAGSLAVPVAITIQLPDEDIKPKSVRVWHSKNNSTQEIIYTSLAADGRTLTFVTPGFSDFIITYDTPKPFSASLLSTGLTVTVVDEKETLKENCRTVYAALYDTSGKLADLVSGTLSGNRITFSKPLTRDYVLFFLNSESVPLQSKTSLT